MSQNDFLYALERGEERTACKIGDYWQVNATVKQKILDIFRNSSSINMEEGFIDKAPLKTQKFKLEQKIRLVPGGTSVRTGAYIGKNVVIMPPSYINIGAYIDDDTMIDSHVLIGSCAQIGKKIHVSAGVQIGGVLEPIGNQPVIVEDNCFIGAGSILTEGVLIRENSVIAPGVILSGSIPVYDLINKKTYKKEIPANAVVVPGTRPVENNQWAMQAKLQLGCAIIVKYRDGKTNAATELEDLLR
ncbi:MAG: 2,3,4,5-tetrahydropyridine-2,6-dicarboxylate N-succinyltransferase [Rickettsiales bacterium]|nr:2,3,4,5-tetrahydropyridine-2,6-dicarboxylate N-succinyltransferase [Rickettsiales bacterium]